MTGSESYHDRSGNDPEKGSAIQVQKIGDEVLLEMGVMRNFGSISADAWAALTVEEARELAHDLICAAARVEFRDVAF